jgi:allantoin racemase
MSEEYEPLIESPTATAPVSATTLGVLRVLTLEDPTAIAAHGRTIEDRFPTIGTQSACIPNHPNGIPTEAAEPEALPDIRSLARDMAPEVDALLISCALDPAIEELQHELDVPVIGAGRSVATVALSMGEQIGALGLEGGIPSIIKDRIGDHLHATEVINGAETTNYLTTETGQEAIIVGAQRLEDAGCDVLAPSCTGLTTSNVLPEIAERTSLTIVDPVLAMAGVALSRWG